jgi:uncharacterized membrane protein
MKSASKSLPVLAALFVVAGVLHFAFPAMYLTVMPPQLPFPLALVYVSGALEIAGGMGILHPRMRRIAGIGLMLLLLAMWPANFQMLFNARAAGAPAWQELLLWLRLPLQPLLMFWVWKATK